jgi:hypothetical protein
VIRVERDSWLVGVYTRWRPRPKQGFSPTDGHGIGVFAWNLCLDLTARGVGGSVAQIPCGIAAAPGQESCRRRRFRSLGAKELKMQRPTGVTILAVLAFIGAGVLVVMALLSLLGGALISSLGSSRMGAMAGVGAAVFAVFFLVFAVVDVVIGIGLWKLQNWARVVTIVLIGLSFLGAVLSILSPFAHMHVFFLLFLVRRLVFAAIYAWILWYLFQPHVKQAFGTTGF